MTLYPMAHRVQGHGVQNGRYANFLILGFFLSFNSFADGSGSPRYVDCGTYWGVPIVIFPIFGNFVI